MGIAPARLHPSPLISVFAVNWSIISFGFVFITAAMTVPTSARGMYYFGGKEKKKENRKLSLRFNIVQLIILCRQRLYTILYLAR